MSTEQAMRQEYAQRILQKLNRGDICSGDQLQALAIWLITEDRRVGTDLWMLGQQVDDDDGMFFLDHVPGLKSLLERMASEADA